MEILSPNTVLTRRGKLIKLTFSDIGQLRLEIEALEEISRQLFLEVHSLKNMQERQRWSRTLEGKYFNVLGHFFSLYCLWKIFIVSFVALLRIQVSSYPLTHSLLCLLVHSKYYLWSGREEGLRDPWTGNSGALVWLRDGRGVLESTRVISPRGLHHGHIHSRIVTHIDQGEY